MPLSLFPIMLADTRPRCTRCARQLSVEEDLSNQQREFSAMASAQLASINQHVGQQNALSSIPPIERLCSTCAAQDQYYRQQQMLGQKP